MHVAKIDGPALDLFFFWHEADYAYRTDCVRLCGKDLEHEGQFIGGSNVG